MNEPDDGNRLLNRRKFLRLCGSTLLSAGISSCRRPPAGNRNRLSIYSWNDYVHPSAIGEFEKAYGISVVYDTVSSNEALLAKFQAGASNYDIIVPSNYAVTKLRKLNLLQPIEKDRLKNFRNLMSRFKNPAGDADPNHAYTIPYTFGTTGLAFNRSIFSTSREYPKDWDAFDNEVFDGRMTMLEDPRESIGAFLKREGKSYNTTDSIEIEQARRELQKQKPRVMCYTSDQVIVYLTSGDSYLSLAFSGDAQQAARENKSVKYIIPASGASVWVDNLCIPRNSPRPDLAHLWIDYILDARVSAALSNYTLYATANEAALQYVDDELKSNPELYPPDEVLSKCEEIRDIGSAMAVYDRQWSELKCS